MAFRQPIITVVGHVDHGKTRMLDAIRSTCVFEKEAGGITQKISFTAFPSEILKQKCSGLLEKFNIKLEIPGFLFIDTPGHAAFSNLRKRGGALADIAILVVDINDGFMPQTEESLQILKENKTPFLVALNKVDSIAGWNPMPELGMMEMIDKQSAHVKQDFDNKMYKIMGSLANYGFDSDLFYRVSDFTKQIALVPTSAKKNMGISELLVMLSGISQRFLKGRLEMGKQTKGTVLEVKKEKDMTYVEAIVYDGSLKIGDNLVIATLDKPIISKLRALFEAMPLKGFKSVHKVTAAAGVRMQFPDSSKVLSGMPFVVAKSSEIHSAEREVQSEVQTIELDDTGIIAKADSLGSLEALMILLKKSGIRVSKVGIGSINKTDAIMASSNISNDPLDAVVLGFNVGVSEDVKNEEKVKMMTNDIIYKLIEDFEAWKIIKDAELKREKVLELAIPAKLSVLRYVFRQSKPAIFGVEVKAGKLRENAYIINAEGKSVDHMKAMQVKGKGVKEAKKGEEVAISLPSITYGRQVKEGDILYVDLTEYQFRNLKNNKELLSYDEIQTLQELAEIKRKTKPTWGV
ncbi:MAG: translation initiation factor IF-2 [Nanoarchaeota archaeon]|nr:translation initiation factor IF-2 [Nanoarchaeota archaeon]